MFRFGLVLDIHRRLIIFCKIANRGRGRTENQRVSITYLPQIRKPRPQPN